VNRRTFLQRLGAGLSLAGTTPFSLPSHADDASPPLGRIAFQLGWIKNFQFAGEYLADNGGYYRKCGLAVDLLSGGPGIVVDPIVIAGRALAGQSASDAMALAVAKGAPITCIGAVYQKSSACIVSLARAPLRTPQDLIGKKIGLQIVSLVIWHAFLKINKIDPAQITVVPVQFDFTPLVAGEVDGFFGEATDDVVHLRSKGHQVYPLLFADFGYRIFDATYSVRTDSLTDKTKRAQLVAFLRAEALGWQDAVKDPAHAGQLTADVYGKANGLDAHTESLSCLAANDFIVSDDTRRHGLFWMSPQAIDETIASLRGAGLKASPTLFTNQILEEVYQGKTTPTP
jgi:ABC-type nitrate/sulfonate/bicarbonate transport system substrate-binding protein